MTLLTDPLKRRRICKVLTYQTIRPHYVLTTSSGEYKIILQLVGVLSHGKIAKRLTDNAIDLMQDVQNLRKAIYECVVQPASRAPLTPSLLDADSCLLSGDFSNKLKAEACAKGSTKHTKLFNLAANYLCATVSFFMAKVWALMSWILDTDTASSLSSRTTSLNADLARRVRIRSRSGFLSAARLQSYWAGDHWTRDMGIGRSACVVPKIDRVSERPPAPRERQGPFRSFNST